MVQIRNEPKKEKKEHNIATAIENFQIPWKEMLLKYFNLTAKFQWSKSDMNQKNTQYSIS